jgi:hypothetical protein
MMIVLVDVVLLIRISSCLPACLTACLPLAPSHLKLGFKNRTKKFRL